MKIDKEANRLDSWREIHKRVQEIHEETRRREYSRFIKRDKEESTIVSWREIKKRVQ